MATTYINAPKGSDITYDQFAFGLGQQGRIAIEESQVWHEQYIKEDEEAKKVWRYEWMQQYLMGNLKVSAKEADRILSQTRDERVAGDVKLPKQDKRQPAVKRASAQFLYHIIRPEDKPKAFKQTKVSLDKVIEMFESLSKAEQAKFMRIVK